MWTQMFERMKIGNLFVFCVVAQKRLYWRIISGKLESIACAVVMI